MRFETVVNRVGEDMGPIDWTHPLAAKKPALWRKAEQEPDEFLLDGRWIIHRLRMYDGWPYWVPRPAILHSNPLNSLSWSFFDSYMIRDNSIQRRPLSKDPAP